MNRINKNQAQSTLEFTFGMIMVMFLIYGMVMIFRWAGVDVAQRRINQDKILTATALPESQLGQDINDQLQPMAAVYHGTVSDGNVSQ